jgi:hypothetical protein
MNENELKELTKTVENLNDEDLSSLMYSLLANCRIFFPYAKTLNHLEEAVDRVISDDDFQSLCDNYGGYGSDMEFINDFLDNLEGEREFEEENEEEVDENE